MTAKIHDPFSTYPILNKCFHDYMEHNFPNSTPIFKAEIKKAFLVGASVAVALLSEGLTQDPNTDPLILAENLKRVALESFNSLQELFPHATR